MLFTAGWGNILKENRNRQIVFTIIKPQCLGDSSKVLSSDLSNNRGGWNKQEGCAKFPELINEEEGITEEGWTFWKT